MHCLLSSMVETEPRPRPGMLLKKGQTKTHRRVRDYEPIPVDLERLGSDHVSLTR